MSTTGCSKAKNWGPVDFKRSALLGYPASRGPSIFLDRRASARRVLLGRIKNRICLVRRTAFILALDSPGRTKSMLSRYIFHDVDSSLAKSTRYRLVQFLKQLFARYDSSTAYCFPRSISRLAFFTWLFKLDFGATCTLSNCSIFAFLNIQLLEPLLLLIKWAFVVLCQFCGLFFVKLALRFLFRSRFRWRKRTRPFLFWWHFHRSKR